MQRKMQKSLLNLSYTGKCSLLGAHECIYYRAIRLQQTIFVFSVLDWNQLAMEANAGKSFQMQIILTYSPHQPPLQASSSAILRMQIWSIHANECVFSRNEQQKVYLALALGEIVQVRSERIFISIFIYETVFAQK